jgi:hypothetical protein
MSSIIIPVAQIEFHERSNTIWIHNVEGGTAMRIKCTGKINVEHCKVSPQSHCDIIVQGDINFCISEDSINDA